MSVTATCGGCAKSFVLSEKFYGKRAKCKECGSVFSVPHPSPVTAGAAPAKRTAAPATRPAAASPARVAPPVMRQTPKPAAPRKAPPPPPPSDLDGMDNPDDIYSLTEAPLAPVPKQVVVEKPPTGPRSMVGPGAKVNAGRSGSVQSYDTQSKVLLILHLVAFGLPILLLLIAKASPGLGPIAGILAVGIACIMILAGQIGMLVEAAKDGVGTVLMYMFIPFYSLYFIFTHMDECKGHLGRLFGGAALIFLAGVLSPEHANIDEDLDEDARGTTPRIVWVREA